MESDWMRSAADLELVNRVQRRAAAQPRAYAWLLLFGAVFLGAYVGVIVGIVSGGGSSVMTAVVVGMFVPAALIESQVVTGARDRFGRRVRYGPAYTIAAIAVGIGMLALIAVGLFGPGYPWWVALIAGIVVVAIIGIRPARMLLAAPRPGGEQPWTTSPLTPPARAITVLIGVYLGAATVLAGLPTTIPQSLLSIAGLILILISTTAPHARWSIAGTGFEWGRAHWIAFAVCLLALFVTGVFIATGATTLIVTAPAGAVIIGAMAWAAFSPRGRSEPRTPER